MSESSTIETEAPDEQENLPDLEPIMPTERRIDVAGMPCKVRRLKTREFLSLINVLTSGLGPALTDVSLDFTDPDAVARDMSALMLLAVPNAVDEFTVFLRSVVDPIDADDRGKVAAYLMDNPDIDVLLDIFEIVASQEKDDLATLAGKAQAMWKRVGSLYSRKK